nr:reverse transcriptase domain-containing protein [Tanacetum cinerariifolium]
MRSTGIKSYIDPISGCDQTIRVIQRRRIDKEGNVSRFQEYHTSDEDEEELNLESTASNQSMSLTMEDTEKYTRNPPDVTEIIAQQLQNIIPNIMTQVTTSTIAMVMEMVEETMVVPIKDLWRVDLETLTELEGKVCREFIHCKALTWWNTQVQPKGRDAANAMAWDDFMALLTMEFCPSNEIEKLEVCSGTLVKAGEKRKKGMRQVSQKVLERTKRKLKGMRVCSSNSS